MKLHELQTELARIIIRDSTRTNRDVVILTQKPSWGPKSHVGIESVREGIDWEQNLIMLQPDKPVVPKTPNEEVYDLARDLMMYIATKPTKNLSYEIRTARRIMKMRGVDYMRYQKLYHGTEK